MQFRIGERLIGDHAPVFIVAEMSANHQQDFDVAVKIIKAAKKTGADAIKMQTYTPDSLTIDCDNEYFSLKQGTIWDGQTLYRLYQKAYTPWEWQPKLKQIAEEEGMICFSTPFDTKAVDFLEGMNVPAYKIASFEITDIPLIEYIATKKKPVLFSTGVATISDIDLALKTLRNKGIADIVLLKCTSEYPAPLEAANLRTIPNMAETFRVVPGLSDHTLGITVPLTAVALGAKVIEKHFTLDRSAGGADAAFSLEPEEFTQMVQGIRECEKALGEVNYTVAESTLKKGRVFSRSLFVIKDMEAGELFTSENVRSIRPGYGLHPVFLRDILGKKARVDIRFGTPLHWDLVD
ncbi:MAG TPA: pseudaminic acid synthase [Thermotogota bacterium]|jgi:pseudaminic acid synthase|nr:pseudaminic acid synthase [Thermotogota bacterium]NLH19332.1 pseudaminic acid synthase [Thermotogaceae bacterium]OQC32270.1 MAG: Pseudaminic acid synthase [Thermotogota bacterium ADurb.Bin062]HNW46098.1 pseudaminic acid synthase [Thermotogota bacterium]HNY81958.1 pseudaminic acid synthase [Thermotogota bacterium]